MGPQEDYKSIWLSKISDFQERARNADGYNRLLRKEEELFVEIEAAIRRYLELQSYSDADQQKVLTGLGEDRGYTQAKSSYRGLVRRHKELMNIEVQVRRSDLESKTRFLIFRILTAIGIALVILGTGFVAYRAGIPLPLLKLGA
jgi:hypothetical protein